MGRHASLPPSLWVRTAIPAPFTRTAAGDSTYDVAIVGAGYTGLSAAIHLADKGVRVVVLEAAEIGWGASGRNGGQVVPGFKIDPDDLDARLGAERGARACAWAGAAPDLVFDIVDRFNIRCAAVRNGWIQTAYSQISRRALEARCGQWSRRGAPVRVLDPSSLPAMLGTPRYVGGWIDRRGGSVNPLSYCRGLAAAALGLGASVFTGSPVLSIDREGSTSWRLTTPDARITAARLIMATGAYGGRLVSGLERSLIPIRVGEVATAPLRDCVAATILPGRQATSDGRRLITSFRITEDNRLVMGGAAATSGAETASLRRSLHVAGRDLFGHLGALRWEFFWSGLFAVTQDKIPHLHEPAPSVLAVAGCNGRGIALSTALGKVVADYVLGRSATDLELPITGVVPMPYHRLRRAVVPLVVALRGYQDRRDLSRN